MTKETPELIAECWLLLLEYIPDRDHSPAAEQLFGYLTTVLSKEELEAIADMDSDLADAYLSITDEEYDSDEDDSNSEDFN
jgi:hypothetical protein